MPSRSEIVYFGAGPAGLPTSVLERASANLLNYQNTGLGLAEHSHRSALSTGIITAAAANLQKLLNAPAGYTTLFMHGGGTTQFSAVVYNLLGYWVQTALDVAGGDLEAVRKQLADAKIDYLVTGSWSQKASAEAKRLVGDGMVNVATDSKSTAGKYGGIPEEGSWRLTPKEWNIFTYFCDNETVDGVEFPTFPKSLEGRGLVAADMSSNILSRAVDVGKYALIFAGAQKNVGAAGVTIVLLRDEILKKQPSVDTLRALNLPIPPIMLSYPPLAANNSLYNTLPIFDVYIAGEVMADLVTAGGLTTQEGIANKKAEMIYSALEVAPALYKLVADKPVRSRMNMTFRIAAKGGNPGGDVQSEKGAETDDLEKAFLKGAEERGLMGLKGHRSVGGIRISNYNSIDLKAAENLTKWIVGFAERK